MATMSTKSLAALQKRISTFIDQEFEMHGYKWSALEGAEGLNERLRFYKCTPCRALQSVKYHRLYALIAASDSIPPLEFHTNLKGVLFVF